MLKDNVLATLVFSMGHNRYVFVYTVYDLIGNSALAGLVHREHYR